VTNDPSPDDTQQELALIQRSMGGALRKQGDLTGALAADREAVRMMGERTAKAPPQTLWQREQAVSHRKAGLDLPAADAVRSLRRNSRVHGVSRVDGKRVAELAAYCRAEINAARNGQNRAEIRPGINALKATTRSPRSKNAAFEISSPVKSSAL
jgi:hypothetical protein